MSYRDLRNCTEMLRTLGYPKPVSMESFRKPNFVHVSTLLLWLAKKFDPDAELSSSYHSEEERIQLIRNVAQFMALKANVKLNTKRLYQADGYAVKELLKIASLLYDAMVNNTDDSTVPSVEDVDVGIRDFDITDKLNDLRQSRQLATEITMSGASLFDLLAKEINSRAVRQVSVSRQHEVHEVEAAIREAVQTLQKDIDELKDQIDNISATEASLDSKIERQKVEIDRYEKRLHTLKKVRPAFLDEFNALEAELNSLFDQYSTRVRSLAHLEKIAADAEQAQAARALMLAMNKPHVKTIPLEDNANEDEFMFDEPSTSHAKVVRQDVGGERKPPSISRLERPRARTGGRTRQSAMPQPPAPKLGKVFGGMNPGVSNSNSSLDFSSESDDDELFLDKNEPELVDIQSDDDSMGLEISMTDLNKRAPSGRMTSKLQLQDNSDDDF